MITGFAPHAVYWLISLSAVVRSQAPTSKASVDWGPDSSFITTHEYAWCLPPPPLREPSWAPGAAFCSAKRPALLTRWLRCDGCSGQQVSKGEAAALDAVAWGCSSWELPAQQGSAGASPGQSEQVPLGSGRVKMEMMRRWVKAILNCGIWPVLNSIPCFWGHSYTVSVPNGVSSSPFFFSVTCLKNRVFTCAVMPNSWLISHFH